MLPRLVLASSSPRRLELLAAVGVVAEVRPPDVDERSWPGEPADRLALRLARAKATAVVGAGELVLGADTVVVIDDGHLAKPTDDEDVARMLGLLSGREHRVLTGVAAALDGEVVAAVCTTAVRFRPLDADDVDWYRSTGEGRDKAGAYGIQGAASVFVESITGSYTNVVGLPVSTVDALCRQLGWPLRSFAQGR